MKLGRSNEKGYDRGENLGGGVTAFDQYTMYAYMRFLANRKHCSVLKLEKHCSTSMGNVHSL